MKKFWAALMAACVTMTSTAAFAYINVSGRTVADVIAESGFESIEEFRAEYGLGDDITPDMPEADAYYSIPTGRIAQMYNMTFEQMKEMLNLSDDITEDTPWGDAEGSVTLEYYLGLENLDDFKVEYGLGDDVTADTTWGEVRDIVDQATLDMQNMFMTAYTAANEDEVDIVLDGEPLSLDVGAYIKNDRTMVPLRGVFEAVGANVSWNDDKKTIFITKVDGDDVKFIIMQAGNDIVFINETEKHLDVPAEIVDGRTMVPLRFIMEELGADVGWDGDTKTVFITTK